jgi:hypothetical protein
VWTLPVGLHELLLQLLKDLDAAIDGPTDDPVVQRLFPRAVDGEDDADREMRMLLAGDLLLRRHEAIRACTLLLEGGVRRRARSGVRVVLEDDEPDMMLAILNDIRLALGARVGATAVELRQLVDDDDEETHRVLETMDLLAWCQMQLLEHIDPSSARHDDVDLDDRPGVDLGDRPGADLDDRDDEPDELP